MKRIGITMGDPGGVGPEILLRILDDEQIRAAVDPIVFGDPELFGALGDRLGMKPDFHIEPAGIISAADRVVGRFDLNNAKSSVACLRAAADAVEQGRVDALVTAPIHKSALRVCRETGPGHTEWLAHRFGVRDCVMLLSGPKLKVISATTHLALRKVPSGITYKGLLHLIELSDRELRRYFYPHGPRLVLAALNPHGEESGDIGAEERGILYPVVAQLQEKGVNIQGPLSGDTVFHLAVEGRYDVVVALYHDQGLGPIKTLHFHEVVNVTLGLGVVRTSPGHGVAYDLAHQARADTKSFKQAILLAQDMVQSDACKNTVARQGSTS